MANREGLGAEKLAGKVLGCEGGLPGWAGVGGRAGEAAEGPWQRGTLSDAPAPSPVLSSLATGSPSTRAAGI